MRIHPLGRHEPRHGLLISLVLVDQLRRDAPRADDLAPAIDVHQERIQRPRPLLDALLQLRPFGGGKDPGEHVERDQPVRIAPLAIDGEGDPDPAEQSLRLGLFQAPQLLRHGGDPVLQARIGGPHARPLIHLVELRHRSPLAALPCTRSGPLPYEKTLRMNFARHGPICPISGQPASGPAQPRHQRQVVRGLHPLRPHEGDRLQRDVMAMRHPVQRQYRPA